MEVEGMINKLLRDYGDDILKKLKRRLENYSFKWTCQRSGRDVLDQGKPSILLSEEFYFQYFRN